MFSDVTAAEPKYLFSSEADLVVGWVKLTAQKFHLEKIKHLKDIIYCFSKKRGGKNNETLVSFLCSDHLRFTYTSLNLSRWYFIIVTTKRTVKVL